MNLMKNVVLLTAASVLSFTACGKGADAPAGDKAAAAASVDTLDAAALKDGESKTVNLKFWMKNRGLVGEALVDNAHFDDGANKRVVFTFDAALGDKIAKLEQGKTYKVTFTVKNAGDGMNFGAMTAVD